MSAVQSNSFYTDLVAGLHLRILIQVSPEVMTYVRKSVCCTVS